MNSPPGGTGGWVTSGTPSKRFSRRRPCQWIVDGRSIEFVKRTTMRVFWATRRSGPGYWPLKPYMTKVRPPILRFTMRASRAIVSPSATWRISRGVAHAREAVSTPSPGRKGSTDGLTPRRPGSMGLRSIIMIMSPEPRTVSIDMDMFIGMFMSMPRARVVSWGAAPAGAAQATARTMTSTSAKLVSTFARDHL